MKHRKRRFVVARVGVVSSLLLIAGCGKERTDEAVEHHPDFVKRATEEIIVRLDKHKVFHAGIKVEPVAKRSVSIPLTLPGKVSFNERRLAHVTARVGGRVEK
ncbi:MAG: hypothetical protein AAB393_08730, partial [Bacteroidota bacterium]